jgi:hypothetical protein
LQANEFEASISAGLPLEPGLLTHEVIVSKGGVFTFFRNGAEVASVTSPRAVTDCEVRYILARRIENPPKYDVMQIIDPRLLSEVPERTHPGHISDRPKKKKYFIQYMYTYIHS